MRKRKRGQGTYIDDETGNSGNFETTKFAKRAHQRTGKWYKEPTERELRVWEREEAQQKAAEKIHKRELNRKVSAEKRAEKEAREQELKQKMFAEGKITFTQTLAKKDEDQLNLHNWFGGRKQADAKNMPKILPPVPKWSDESMNESKRPDLEGIAQRLSQCTELDKLISEDLDTFFHEDVEDLDIEHEQEAVENVVNEGQSVPNDAGDHFEIAEDGSAEDGAIGYVQVIQNTEQGQLPRSDHAVTSPPQIRPPLSPLSQADLNTRASITPTADKFDSGIKGHEPDTRNLEFNDVKDLLSNLCTQDLDVDDALLAMEKENQDPVNSKSLNSVKGTVSKRPSITSVKPTITPKAVTISFGESNTDYDSLFAELDPRFEHLPKEPLGDYGDAELDDETLLSISATQRAPARASKRHETIKPSDSFAVDGLSDNDLLEGLDDYERSQRSQLTKKRRPLPWDKPEWHEALQAQMSEKEEIPTSQCTELLDG